MRDRANRVNLEPWADFRAAGLVVPGRVHRTQTDATMPDGTAQIIEVSPIHIGDETVLAPVDAAVVNRISPPRERRVQ